MQTLSFRHIILILLGVTLLFSACKRDKDASKQAGKHKSSKEALTVTDKTSFDLNKIDTVYYYYGTVEDSSFYFKIDKTDKESLSGHYYPVGKFAWLDAVPFSIHHRDKKYIFVANGNQKSIQFSIVLDTAVISGEFATDPAGLKKKPLYFKRYHAPAFTNYESKRFQDTVFSVMVKPDVEYGNAKGYWSSYPMSDTKYLKMLTKTLGKTASHRNLNLTMDIYMPEGDTMQRHPLIVFIHGGAFYFGDKGAPTMTTWCRHFAREGYVTASINYRLGFQISKASIQKSGYMAIQDAHAAIRYLVAHAKDYGVDTNAIFVAGTSAGAITALNVALWTNATRPPFVEELNIDKKLGRLESSGNNLHNTFKIKAIANMWGAIYDLEVLKNKRIPIISFHGTQDHVVPYDEGYPFSSLKSNIGEKLFDKMYGSKTIHDRLNELHVPNKFYPLEGVGHAPYENPDGTPNHYYYFIQGKIDNFFYGLLCGNCSVSYDKKNPIEFSLHNKNIRNSSWKVEGGFITDINKEGIKVLWRKDAPAHSVTATGQLENGASFSKQIKLKVKK